MRDPFNYTWWLASRAAGIVAVAALGAVCVLGLASALRLVNRRTAAVLRPWHERLAQIAVGCILLHGALLLVDPWLHPGPVGVAVPFTMSYRPVWTGLGVIAGWLALGFLASFYVRRRIGGARVWRSAHRFAPVALILGVLHAMGAGTDARSPLLLGILLVTGSAVALLAFARVAGLPAPVRRPPARQAAEAPPIVR
jgi:sulfoxide reductase heme-binding subunit YedZ